MSIELPFIHQDKWRWRWMHTFNGEVIHRVMSFSKESEEYGACVEDAITVCGLEKKWLLMPGVFTRMEGQRCKNCCRSLEIPYGSGAPFNKKIEEPTILIGKE